jgi:hypothetical protein
MRQRLTIILTFVVIIGLLVVLNGLSHVQQDDAKDLEVAPNRSTYHSGPTGTRALYDLLSESGHQVMRWREPPERLIGQVGEKVSTFVLVGSTRVPVTKEDATALLSWAASGGRLVIIDREPEPSLLEDKRGWTIFAQTGEHPSFETDSADVAQMTETVTALRPTQTTVLTEDVQAVLPSRFASRLSVSPVTAKSPNTVVAGEDEDSVAIESESPTSTAPVIHIADSHGALVVDRVYGNGRVIVISDPYIVANRGISLKDNLKLALNTVAGREGVIAFDEYHQGKGITENAFASYFRGTPVLPIAFQIGALVLFVLWTNARRFGRPLPLPQVDRRSSLEFVASMAELQERSRAFDLALENIYSRTRRVLARYAGLDYNSSRSDIASRVAARSSIDAHQLETLMRQCEDAINGQPISWRQSLDLVKRLREIETTLGLRMRSRELRQAAENI